MGRHGCRYKGLDGMIYVAILATMLPAQPNQSLIDGLACLQALASTEAPIGGRELARELGLEPTRVNRLLKTLAHLGLAEQGVGRKYQPGPGIHVLAAQAMFGSGLLRRAASVLEDLRRFRLTVAMGVLWRDRVAYLYHAAPKTPPGQALGRVGLFPAAQSGLGLAILAGRKNAEVEALYPVSATCRAVMVAVRQARKRGYALVQREAQNSTLAVRLDTADAAIGLAGRLNRHDVDHLAGALQDAAACIRKAGHIP